MQKCTHPWQTAGFLFTVILGTLLHFVFAWSGRSLWTAPFSAVNESIWEHMKLIYFPMVLFALIQNHFQPEKHHSFWCIKLVAILTALILIPVIYYTYTGILGISADWFNIAIFFIAASGAFLLERILLCRNTACPIGQKLAIALIAIIGLLFVILTFLPPQIPLFQDPLTRSYGYHS